MFLKLLGSTLILGASGFLGYVLSQDFIKRPQELRTLQGLLQMLENEIKYMANVLSDAFEKVSRSSSSAISVFFKDTIEQLEKNNSLNSAQAWEMAIRNNIKNTALNKEDEEILISFGKLLGNTDVDGQIKNIKLTLTQLKLQEQKAEEARLKYGSMYRKLGILGGVALVIILL
jgi:stage III sporulation protein AB